MYRSELVAAPLQSDPVRDGYSRAWYAVSGKFDISMVSGVVVVTSSGPALPFTVTWGAQVATVTVTQLVANETVVPSTSSAPVIRYERVPSMESNVGMEESAVPSAPGGGTGKTLNGGDSHTSPRLVSRGKLVSVPMPVGQPDSSRFNVVPAITVSGPLPPLMVSTGSPTTSTATQFVSPRGVSTR